MKTITSDAAAAEMDRLLDAAQKQRVLITRNGRAAAVLVGLAHYDAEDRGYAESREFWQIIELRRKAKKSVAWAEVKLSSGNASGLRRHVGPNLPDQRRRSILRRGTLRRPMAHELASSTIER